MNKSPQETKQQVEINIIILTQTTHTQGK